ncbi:DUF924 family protein [Psychromonas sp.]|uniref:DUF924 family protein n=1 Tax=Psychromonas sp. TaxID=1884585 RepID=UPI00356591F8
MKPEDILSFWFDETEPEKWWVKDSEFDVLIKKRFLPVHECANQCELYEWRNSAGGRLAEIIILDQFSRNIFRDTPQSFVADQVALALAQEAISLGKDIALSDVERAFFYMPFMHSESLKIHQVGLRLFEANGIQSYIDFEIKHKAIIEKFGRYPHRNNILGRRSTPAEMAFLKQPDSSF